MPETGYVTVMLIIGIACLLIGFIAGIPLLWTIGIVLTVIGAVLLLVGVRRPVGYSGRRYWY